MVEMAPVKECTFSHEVHLHLSVPGFSSDAREHLAGIFSSAMLVHAAWSMWRSNALPTATQQDLPNDFVNLDLDLAKTHCRLARRCVQSGLGWQPCHTSDSGSPDAPRT